MKSNVKSNYPNNKSNPMTPKTFDQWWNEYKAMQGFGGEVKEGFGSTLYRSGQLEIGLGCCKQMAQEAWNAAQDEYVTFYKRLHEAERAKLRKEIAAIAEVFNVIPDVQGTTL